MNAPLYLSRARLRTSRGEALGPIAHLLISRDKSRSAGHAHHVVWLLFQDALDSARDFLWRDEGDAKFLILSPRLPSDPNALFEIETKSFEPSLSPGDRLRFALRANPTMASKQALSPVQHAKRERGKRVDVVMHALYAARAAEGEAPISRDALTAAAGERWLVGQGERAGFSLDGVPAIANYTQTAIERSPGRRPAGISTLDFSGRIIVTEPALFLEKLAKGFGGAKAFGNGLMLIRRV